MQCDFSPGTPDTEEEIYRTWQSMHMPVGPLCTRQGDRLTILSPGSRNEGAGPDFRNGLILLNGSLRRGPIEMHLREQDWFAHGHDSDPSYDAVVLHVLGLHGHDNPLRLPHIATVTIDDVIAGCGAAKPRVTPFSRPEPASQTRDTVRMLAEMSWNRLLRRGTEILRALPASPVASDFDREFGARLFDALGYSRNRSSMAALFDRFWQNRVDLPTASVRDFVGRVYTMGAQIERRMRNRENRTSSRPFNSPDRRHMAAGILGYQLLCGELRDRLLNELQAASSPDTLESRLEICAGSQILVGRPRAADMVVNALLPLGLTVGTIRRDPDLIAATCLTYREYRSLQSNHVLRRVEKQLGISLGSAGAFLQQGALEYDRFYGSPDRTRRTFVAEQTKTYTPIQQFA